MHSSPPYVRTIKWGRELYHLIFFCCVNEWMNVFMQNTKIGSSCLQRVVGLLKYEWK